MAVNLGNSPSGFGQPPSRKILKTSEGKLILFAYLGDGASNRIQYKTSDDNGVTWSSWNNINFGRDINEALWSFDVQIDSSNNIHVFSGDKSTNGYYEKLTYSSGTWSNGTPTYMMTDARKSSILIRSNGDIWIFCYDSGNTRKYYVYSTDGGSSWSGTQTLTGAAGCFGLKAIEVGSDIWIIYSTSGSKLQYRIYNGSWGSETDIASITNAVIGVGKVSDSEIYAAAQTSSGIKVYKYNGSWDSGTLLSDSSNDCLPSISIVGGKPAVVWSDFGGGIIYDIAYRYWNGSTWNSVVIMTDSDTGYSLVTTIESDTSYLYVDYVINSGSYPIYFDKVQLVIPSTQQTITSDSHIKSVDNQETIISDSEIVTYRRKTITSDSCIKAIGLQQTINSDSMILDRVQKTINSNSNIKSIGDQKTITSDSEIVDPYNSKFINNNNLFVTVDTDPAQIIKVDITAVPIWTIQNLATFKNAKFLSMDDVRNKLYVSCNDGYIIKVDMSLISSYSANYVGEVIQLYSMATQEDYLITYAADAISGLSLFSLDEGEYEVINTDLRTRKSEEEIINTILLTKFQSIINTDLRTRIDAESIINTDLRTRIYDYDDLSFHTIAREDFSVYIDGVECGDEDLDLASIKITHTSDEKSVASFVLNRKFDNLDNPTQISNHNLIEIYIKDKKEFGGNILSLQTDSQNEIINVNAESNTIPYKIQTWSQTITNVLDPIEITPSPTGYNGQYIFKVVRLRDGTETELPDGSGWSFTLPNIIDLTFPTFQVGDVISIYYYSATSYSINSVTLPLANYDSSHPYKILLSNVNIDNPSIVSTDPNPKYYQGTRIYLGQEIKERVVQWGQPPSAGLAALIQNTDIEFIQGYTYFWYVSVQLVTIFGKETFPTEVYIGTSLSPLSSNVFKISSARYYIQKDLGNLITELGYYTVGSAPYKDVSANRNGRYIAIGRYEDKDDGLYYSMNTYYDYEDYCEAVADLEYQKMLNINDDLFPKTSADIDLFIDAYLFYKIALLTRINISNTTTADIYNNANGFPISVKQISIDSGSMSVKLSCDNNKSQYELSILDGNYPTEPDTYGNYSYKIASKYDLSKKEYTE